MQNENIVNVIRDLSLQAGARIMEIYGQDDFEVRTKSDDSPVTKADEAADKLIFAGLTAAFPDIPIVTEEQSDSHSVVADRFFIVDPLDGTKEFVHRRGDFTVNIALIEDGVPVLGVVFAPDKGRLFYTDKNGKSVEEMQDGSVKPIRVSTPDMAALTVVASKSHRDQATDDYIAKYNVENFRAAGSSLKFCLVATGEADLYPRLGRTMEWDTAAGHAVLRGAGGDVVRFDTHEPLTYGKPIYENPFFIAYAPGIQLEKG
ncbi:MAG: 3'(2'),5'-bisphosphate nucleotidase CysQ [Rhodobacteraceae bacterium]|nr:3'(2'),5'-bisphosphate nucleotidase CysQ [Paracoccaceae bacterium]